MRTTPTTYPSGRSTLGSICDVGEGTGLRKGLDLHEFETHNVTIEVDAVKYLYASSSILRHEPVVNYLRPKLLG